MSGIAAFALWGGILAVVGWAAWTLSGGFTTERPKPDTPYRHGIDALLRGDVAGALRAFAATGEIDTGNVDGYLHIGNLLRERGDVAGYRTAAGESYLRAGKAREAERQFKDALRLDKDHPLALLRLGDICYRRDHKERALVLWRGLARTHPDHAHLVLERLETAYFERGRMSEMSQTYEDLLSQGPNDPRIHLALARMYIKKGDLTEACQVLEKALVIAPESLAARLLLVNVHRRLGDLSRALDEMEVLTRGIPSTERFTCSSCGAASEEYWTRCPQCLAWSVA